VARRAHNPKVAGPSSARYAEESGALLIPHQIKVAVCPTGMGLWVATRRCYTEIPRSGQDTEHRMANGESGSQRPEDRKPGDDPPDLPEEFLQYRNTPPAQSQQSPDVLSLPEGRRSAKRGRRLWLLLVLLVLLGLMVTGVLFASGGFR
jgi:hypothetical protein